MVFNSLIFLVFFALILGLHSLPLSWRTKKINLVVASYVFYAWWNPPFVLLLIASTIMDWFAARGVYSAKTPASRRVWLAATLGVNFGLLGYFKYGGFLLSSFASLVNSMGGHYHAPEPNIILPIGISFYTFVTLSYTLDVYWKKMKPWDSFLDYALLVTFFPHLVAGPILRASYFLPQCQQPRQASRRAFCWGLSLLVLGLFEKVVLADWYFAPIANTVYNQTEPPGFVDAWLGTMAFSGQIFCDFAGYSTCAIGIALCLGFSLPQNFRFPYSAIGFSDFWRRWHISLSTWLRDYLYFPLGGNRRGRIRTYGNLLLTMLLGGLWHGASWTFVAWGGLHGLFLAGEHAARSFVPQSGWWRSNATRLGLAVGTYLLVCVTWVFFRAHTFPKAFEFVACMAGRSSPASIAALTWSSRLAVVLLISAVLAIHLSMRERRLEDVVARTSWTTRCLALSGMLSAIVLAKGNHDAFIYFQF